MIEEPWTVLTVIIGVTIWKRYKGEVRFGPVYLNFKTEPTIQELDNKIFGDWFYTHGEGLFLQVWNKTDTPNTNLVYLDTKDKKIKTIKNSIDSVLWDIIALDGNTLELKCDTGYRILTYKLEL